MPNMTIEYSELHHAYVATQYGAGVLYTGRGETADNAVLNCLLAMDNDEL